MSSDIVPAATASSRELPRVVGPYTLFEPVGRGGMAELFLARTETELGATRLAVVKLILPAFADDPKFAEMLIHEAKLAASLSNRHIVQVLDLGRTEPTETNEAVLYIAMEYVEGFDLNALLRKCSEMKEGLPVEHALGIVADILEGLDYAHRRGGEGAGIVHRDVSPSNILISYEGEVKLCDFGIAHANDLVREEASEALKGKAGYMSPEHARAEMLDARADVFAAGIILWELLAGRRLYKFGGDIPLLEQARRAEIPPIPDKGLPDHEELARIVSKALAKNRDERYASASAFQRDLEEYLAKAGLLASRLKLGEWLAATFGTTLIEERRASESRLPLPLPAPRSSGHLQLRTKVPVSIVVPSAPRIPSDLIETPPARDVVAITPEESLPMIMPTPTPKSTDLDLHSSDSTALASASSRKTSAEVEAKANANKMDVLPRQTRPTVESAREDEELIAWAKKRGVVSFLFFFAIAVMVAAGWYLTR